MYRIISLITLCFFSNLLCYSQITLNIHEKSNNKLQFSDIFSSVQLIQLETNTQCLISGVRNVKIDGNHIFLYDPRLGKVFVYNMQGEFVARIGQKGRGPGEMIEPRGFTLDNKDKLIAILDAVGKKMLYFNYRGEYVKSTESIFVLHYEKLSDSTYIGYSYNGPIMGRTGPAHGDLVVFDNQGRILKEFGNIRRIPQRLSFVTSTNLTVDSNFDAYLVPIFETTLYKFSPDLKCQKIAYLNFDTKIPKDVLTNLGDFEEVVKVYSKNKYPYLISGLKVTNNLLCFNFSFNKQRYYSFWRMNSDEIQTIKQGNFINDLGGITTGGFEGEFDYGFIDVIDAVEFKEMFSNDSKKPNPLNTIKQKEIREKLISIANSISIDDNPVLFLYTLKK